MTDQHTLLEHAQEDIKTNRKKILIGVAVSLGVLVLLSGACAGYFAYYQHRIYPNVTVGGMNIGGLTTEEALNRLQHKEALLLDDGMTLATAGTETTLYPTADLRTTGSSDPDLVYDLIYFNLDKAVDDAFALGREERAWQLTGLLAPLQAQSIAIPTVIDRNHIESQLLEQLDQEQDPGEPTDFDIVIENGAAVYTVTEGTVGTSFDFESFFADLEQDVQDLELGTPTLTLATDEDLITQAEAESLFPLLETIFSNEDTYQLTYESPQQRRYTWNVRWADLADWLQPVREEDALSIAFAGDAFETFVADVEEDVNVAPTNARFSIDGNRVTEFAGSSNGVDLDTETTFDALLSLIQNAERESVIMAVTTTETEPEISTGSVNNLGINEILGVGVSDFSGSPSNRVKNIQNGAAKLNGLLIGPGETLSLIEQLKPFTLAGGYLPELVIKGDEIKPEIGGGLCQIGTTTFRAAMNAGLEITERRNHSLVVSYYDDPSNGNPGTDATIYDPAPDFKVTNDTENYVLLTTDVDLSTYHLYFTFWGTSDGRSGYYTAPEVLSWSGYGETQYIETTDLAPGVEQCQSPHPGATTAFTYYVDYADGTQHEKEYVSTYRSLPWICLVGVDPNASTECEGEDCEEGSEEGTEESAEDETEEAAGVEDTPTETE